MSQIHVTLTWVWSPWSIFSRSSGLPVTSSSCAFNSGVSSKGPWSCVGVIVGVSPSAVWILNLLQDVQQHNALLNGKSLQNYPTYSLHWIVWSWFPPKKMDNLQYWSLIYSSIMETPLANWSSSLLFVTLHVSFSMYIDNAVNRLLKSPKIPPFKHHPWPPGCLSLWQRDNLFAIGPPTFEESTWRTNHPEMAGSKKNAQATNMLPKTGWNMTKKYYLLGVSIILREWLCLVILFWDDVPRCHCIRNAKTWQSMTRMPQVSWHLNVLHSIWDRIYIVAKSSKKQQSPNNPPKKK